MTIAISINGTPYEVPSSAADTNWAALQVAFEQALAAGVNDATDDAAAVATDLATLNTALATTWAARTPAGTWVNVGGGQALQSMLVTKLSMVALRGDVSSGSTSTLTTLPSGQHPPKTVRFIVPGDATDDLVLLAIDTNGVVTLDGINGATPADTTHINVQFPVNT